MSTKYISAYVQGYTLIELIITIVVLAIGVVVLGSMVSTIGGKSASPVIQTQGLYIAEAYLEEASLKSYNDPDGVAEGCAVTRDLWDDIGDYGTCLAAAVAPTNPQGDSIAALARYRVSMTVGAPAVVGGVNTRRLEVRVTHLDGRLDVRIAALRAQ